jgi:hypothetical protein
MERYRQVYMPKILPTFKYGYRLLVFMTCSGMQVWRPFYHRGCSSEKDCTVRGVELAESTSNCFTTSSEIIF